MCTVYVIELCLAITARECLALLVFYYLHLLAEVQDTVYIEKCNLTRCDDVQSVK